MRVIYAPGCFDLFHRGHLNLLWRAKALGDVLIVGVVSDSGAAAYKRRWPAHTLERRMRTVERLTFVDVVVRQDTTDPTPVLELWRPDVLVHGDDWDQLREGHETLARLGIEYVSLPYTPDISTTMLREQVSA